MASEAVFELVKVNLVHFWHILYGICHSGLNEASVMLFYYLTLLLKIRLLLILIFVFALILILFLLDKLKFKFSYL